LSLFKASLLGIASTLVLVSAGKPEDSGASAVAPQFAEVTYLKGYKNSGLGNASNQFYSHAYDDTCESVFGGAKFAPLSGSKKTVRFEAGRRTIINAVTNNFQGSTVPTYPGSVAVDESTCFNKGAFTPKPGAVYQIVQRRENTGACRLEITDLATGTVPEDFVELRPVPCVKTQRKKR
jgi:hypothetical protein